MESKEYFIREATAFYNKGKYEKAIEFAELAADDKKYKGEFYAIMGLAYYGLDEFEKSIQHLEKAITLNPSMMFYMKK